MSKFTMILAMLIFGTIGIFVSHIPASPSIIALFRAGIGTLFMLLILMIKKDKIKKEAIFKNLLLLTLSGLALCINWILLFESYRYTSVAISTVCNYMAPVFILLVSPLILKESLTPTKILCAFLAILGVVLISDVFGEKNQDIRGILLSLSAAVLYCFVVILNKLIKDLPSIETTFLQLGISAIVLTPYVLITEDLRSVSFTPKTLLMLVCVGFVHTGIAYLLYFSAIKKMPAQTSAIFSYIDPVTAVILSVLLQNNRLSLPQVIGILLILGSTFLHELMPTHKKSIED